MWTSVTNSGTRASDYAIEVRRTDKDELVVKRIAELSTANWGLGYFKYNACDYCDDVLAETADATFGDAWIPKYVSDDKGCNVIIIRNQAIQDLFDRYRNEPSCMIQMRQKSINRSPADSVIVVKVLLSVCISTSMANGLLPNVSSHLLMEFLNDVSGFTQCAPH